MRDVKAEIALWRAVIYQAARDGLKYTGGKQSIYSEAYHWFKDNHAQFRFVCELAELEPDIVRAWFIKAYKARHPKYKTRHLECVCEGLLIDKPIEDLITPIENPTIENTDILPGDTFKEGDQS